jgi:hypothetical protein
MLSWGVLVKLNRSNVPWILVSAAAVAIILVVAVHFDVFRPSTSDELMARIDKAIADAIAKAEAGDVDGARAAIPTWSKLNVDYMRPLFQQIIEIRSGVGPEQSKRCSVAGLSISTHLGDAKRAVAFWQIESFGGDAKRIEDAKGGAVAQVMIIGEIAAAYARRCTVRQGDYAGPDRPWIQFLRQISSYPELQADLYLTKIADGEAERLKAGN